MIWYSHLFKSFPQFVMTHTFNGFSVLDEMEVDVFSGVALLSLDPVTVGNLISASFVFSKPSLHGWNFLVRVMLKPSMQ